MTTVGLLLDAALRFARAGIPVFPCTPGAKTPLTAHGFKDATTDGDRLGSWWARWPEANVAPATGAPGYDVLDVDVRPWGSGRTAFETLRTQGLLRGAIAIVRTPSGGFHVYFPGTSQRSSSLRDHLLDFKAVGGYVLAPPSRLSDVGTYCWHEVREEAGEPLDWTRVVSALRPVPRTRSALGPVRSWGSARGIGIDRLACFVAGAEEGNRNNALFWAACEALRSGYRDLSPLRQAALSVGLGSREADQTIRSAHQRTQARRP